MQHSLHEYLRRDTSFVPLSLSELQHIPLVPIQVQRCSLTTICEMGHVAHKSSLNAVCRSAVLLQSCIVSPYIRCIWCLHITCGSWGMWFSVLWFLKCVLSLNSFLVCLSLRHVSQAGLVYDLSV